MKDKNSPKISISGGVLWQARYIALACQESGLPYSFFTTLYVKEDGLLYKGSEFLEYLGFPQLKNKLRKRSYPRLDTNFVQNHVASEILYRIFAKVLRDSVSKCHYINPVYDSWVARRLNECNIFYGYEDVALASIHKAKALGATTILELRSLQPLYNEIEEEEARILGISAPGHLASKKFPFVMERKLAEMEAADFLMVYSGRFKQYLIKTHNINPKKIIILPLGAELEVFYRKKHGAKEDGKFRIIFVGQIIPRKGVHYLLEAVRQLNLKDIELQLIGSFSPDMEPIFERYQGCFDYVGTVPRQELVHYYNSAHIFVLPSLIDSFGLVVYEAMNCGTPVIITENCGAEVEDGVQGFIVPIRDVEALKEKILTLYQDNELRERMGCNAEKWAVDHSLKEYRQRITTILLEIHQKGEVSGLSEATVQ